MERVQCDSISLPAQQRMCRMRHVYSVDTMSCLIILLLVCQNFPNTIVLSCYFSTVTLASTPYHFVTKQILARKLKRGRSKKIPAKTTPGVKMQLRI